MKKMNSWFLMAMLSLFIFSGFRINLYGQSEIYDRIGLIVEHGLHGAVPEENIDLFTGNVTLRYLDINLPGPNGFDLKIWRVYNSKVLKDRLAAGGMPSLQQEPFSWVGMGWTMHMGRVHSYLSDMPVIEFPDGRWETAYRNKYDTNHFVTREFLKYDKNDHKLYFKDGTIWFFNEVRTITYQGYTESVRVATRIQNPYGHYIDISYAQGLPIITRITDSMGRVVDFFTDGNPTYPKLTRIDVKNATGSTVSYHYAVGTYPYGGYYRLTSFDPPELPASTFDYHNGQYDRFELIQVNTSLGGIIQYAYDSQTFYFYSQALTNRVVKQKSITFVPGTPLKTWTYSYPNYYNSSFGTVTVQGPEFTTKVQYFGLHQNPGWKVGLIKQKEFIDGGTTRLTETYDWLPQAISTTRWYVLSTDMGEATAPLLHVHTKTPDGDAPGKEEYLYSEELIKYGLPSRINFYGTNFNAYKYYKTMSYYFQTNTAFLDRHMLSYINNEKIFSAANVLLKENKYSYYEMDGKWGAIKWIKRRMSDYKELTWDYTYSSNNPNFIKVTVDPPGAGSRTQIQEYRYGVLSKVEKPGFVELERTISQHNSSILSETNQHGGTMSFSYDGLGRITAISMPSGFNNIQATWSANSVSISQGTNTVVKYWDGMGRNLGHKETGDGTTLYWLRTLDSEGRVLKENKGSTSQSDEFSYLYNAAGQITALTNPLDHTTTFSYSGNVMTVTDALDRQTVQTFSDMPGLVKNLKDPQDLTAVYGYDAIGRLISLVYNGQRTQSYTYDCLDNIESETHPETGKIEYSYNNENNLESKSWAGVAITYQYNASNQLIKTTSPDEIITYQYDARGRINRIFSSNGWERNGITYNAFGAVTGETQLISGLTAKNLSYTYDGNNNLSGMTYPDGRSASFTNNGLNMPETASFNGAGLISQISYGAGKQVVQMNIVGNGTEYSATYNASGLLESAHLKKTPLDLYQANYEYDQVGNIKKITSTAPTPVLNAEFFYDNLDRLTRADYTPAGSGRVNRFDYQYDYYGNLRVVKENSTTVFSKTFNSKNQINGFSYDLRGNLTAADNFQYAWDSRNRMTKVKEGASSKGNYLYNERGLRLRATPPEPEINIKLGAANVLNGQSVTFTATVGSFDDKEFVIENKGDADLILNGSPIVTITGSDASQFSVLQQPATPVAPNQNTTFKIRFTPTSNGLKTAAIAIASNDPNKNPYNIGFNGRNPAPEMGLKEGNSTIPNGGRLSFISTVNGYADKTLTIENKGDADLILSGTPIVTITGSDASQFSVLQQPATPVAPNQTTIFIIRFAPTSEGTKTAAISIANNDEDENPYDLTLDGIIGYPEINVLQAPNGGAFDFGTCQILSSILETFIIQNIGDAPLILGNPPVTIFSPEEFYVERQPNSVIPPHSSSTFDVRFQPVNPPGYKTATLSIANNDPDENPYEFMLSGYAEDWWPPMRLVLTEPNGEEILLSGSSEKITWKGEETIKEMKIEYSTNNGSSYRQVIDRTPNTGSHEWAVPYGASPSCLVRISDADGAPASPETVSFEMKFKISAPEEARGPESHLKLRFVIPDAWTQGSWFADLEFFPDRSTGTERLVFNQLVAECRSLERFLNTWHVIEVQYDMNAYSGSMWLDGVRIFQKVPLQVSFPMLSSAEISLSADPEARAEIWVDDVALKIGSRSFAQGAEASDEPLFLMLARDSFEAYRDSDMLRAGGWQVADKAVSGDQEASVIDAQESVSGLQSLKLKALDGPSLTVVKSFSLPERFPFDVSDGNFAITDGKMAAAELQEQKVQQSLRGQELRRERLRRRGAGPLLEDRLRSRKSSEIVAPFDEAGEEDHGTGILSIHPNGTYYIYGYDGKLLAEYDGLGNCVRDYIYVGSRLFAEYRPQENKLYYYLSDQISSTRMITDGTGTVVYSAAHDPYGGIQKIWVSAYDPALKFSGKERDAESGLDYFGARYFYTGHYRWLSVDPIINREEALMNPQLWNLYAYCRNSPITYWDPIGLDNYVFYDPQSFVKQAQAEAKRLQSKDNNEPTHTIPIRTEEEFKRAWSSMIDPTDVTLIFHSGSGEAGPTTISIDWEKGEYLTTNPKGHTPKGVPATYIGELEQKTFDTLTLYVCRAGKAKVSENLAAVFSKTQNISTVKASPNNVSFNPITFKPWPWLKWVYYHKQ